MARLLTCIRRSNLPGLRAAPDESSFYQSESIRRVRLHRVTFSFCCKTAAGHMDSRPRHVLNFLGQLLANRPSVTVRHCTFKIRTLWHSRCIASRQMLPTSHHAPMNLPPARSKAPLAEAFKAFMATADRMEASYSQLQGEVARLRRELEERNAALTQSLAENKSIRTALKRILDALPCGVIVIDANDSVVLVNPEAGRLLGRFRPMPLCC